MLCSFSSVLDANFLRVSDVLSVVITADVIADEMTDAQISGGNQPGAPGLPRYPSAGTRYNSEDARNNQGSYDSSKQVSQVPSQPRPLQGRIIA